MSQKTLKDLTYRELRAALLAQEETIRQIVEMLKDAQLGKLEMLKLLDHYHWQTNNQERIYKQDQSKLFEP